MSTSQNWTNVQHTTCALYTAFVSTRPTLDVDIAFARREDALAIAEMSRDLIEQGLDWSWTRERVLRSLRHRETNAIVAKVEGPEGTLAGFGLMRYGETEAHLLLLAVQPSFGRRGVGAALVGWLEASARVAGIERLVLETRATNAAARTFYRRLGFEASQLLPRYYGGRETSVRMAKGLIER
jgi:ribosomal-protein-alanine N-acetyltransferase